MGGRQDQLQKQKEGTSEPSVPYPSVDRKQAPRLAGCERCQGCTGPTPDSQTEKLGYKEGMGKRLER